MRVRGPVSIGRATCFGRKELKGESNTRGANQFRFETAAIFPRANWLSKTALGGEKIVLFGAEKWLIQNQCKYSHGRWIKEKFSAQGVFVLVLAAFDVEFSYAFFSHN